MHKCGNVGCHTNDDIRNDIRADNVIRTAALINSAQKVGNVTLHVIKPCVLDVLTCYLDGNGIYVVRIALISTKLCRADSKNSASATHVKHTLTVLYILFKQADYKAGGLVATRTECHTGIHSYLDLSLRSGVLFPRGNYNDTLTYLDRLIIRLPRVRPVLLANTADGDGGVNGKLGETLLQKQKRVCRAAVRRKINRNGRDSLIGIQNTLVYEITIAGLEVNVTVILDLKII